VGVGKVQTSAILYFENEGRENLPRVLSTVRRALTRRSELRDLKIVVFTATGDGPVLAYSRLRKFDPRIVAVTFPVGFHVNRGEDEPYYPTIPKRLRKFFDGVGYKVITNRLPFDAISNVQAHNHEMQLIKDVLNVFGGGFSLCVQAVLSACDHGEIAIGEKVLSLTGDVAAILTATTTEKFLSKTEGLVVNEILCKPRNLTITRQRPRSQQQTLFPKDDNVIDMPQASAKLLNDKPSK
jgi:hypothetical protein